MIVTSRHIRRKRPAKLAYAATIQGPRIVQHTPKGRALKALPPQADAQVAGFFARMGITKRSNS